MTGTENVAHPTLCLTIDYELFGDGSGDIQKDLIDPTSGLLEFLDRAGIKATFFIELAEVLVFEQALRKGRFPVSLPGQYKSLIHQIGQMLLRGHDVQLHIHPQWFDAFWNGEFWQMPLPHRSLLYRGKETLSAYLQEGKELLESIADDIGIDHSCQIFRAGGLHFDRTPELTRLLLDAGIAMDSSMCRGYSRQSASSSIDFGDLLEVRVPYWYTTDGSVNSSSDGTLIEIPVWSVLKRQYYKLRFNRLMKWFISRQRSKGTPNSSFRTDHIPKSPLGLAAWLCGNQAALFDFCLLTGKQLVEFYDSAVRFHQVDDFFPLVMIGHSKELDSLKPLSEFFEYVRHLGASQWMTLTQALTCIQHTSCASNREINNKVGQGC